MTDDHIIIVPYPEGDHITGTDGNDILNGGDGDDRLGGGYGDDQLYGNKGNDRLSGVWGDDQLYGGDGDDLLQGHAGDDRLWGEDGNDDLWGGNESVLPAGGEALSSGGPGDGDDRLYGGDGNDRLYGGDGNDELWGGDDNDRDSGGAGDGDDYLHGGYGNDLLYGGTGQDALTGWTGNDRLYGGDGRDTLNAWYGDDLLYGGDGDDRLWAGPGSDQLYGGDGADQLYGEAGSDQLYGGDGRDTFLFEPGDSTDGGGDVINDFAPGKDEISIRGFSSDNLTLSGLIDADGDGAKDDRKITLPDGGIITLLNISDREFGIEGFTLAEAASTESIAPDEPQPAESTATQPLTLFEQHLRLANTPVESGGANDGGRARRQVELNEGETGRVDAGDLDGLTLPEDEGGAYSGRYELYWNPGDSGSYQLRFDDATTGNLTPSSTAAAIDAALGALDGITSAEVTGDPGDWTLTITATEGHLLQPIDVAFDGDLQLDYLGA